MQPCIQQQGGCLHRERYPSRYSLEKSHICSENFVVLNLKTPECWPPINTLNNPLRVVMVHRCTAKHKHIENKKRIHEKEEAQKAGGGLCSVGLEGGPPLHHIPSFIIHAAIYCTHIQYTRCASHCPAHKLGQGVAATGAWELAQIVTVSVLRVGACLMVYCACVRRAPHLSLSVEPRVCLLGALAFSVPLITRENESMTHDSNLSPQFLCSGEAKQTFNKGCAENWRTTGRLLRLLHFDKVYIFECVEILPL